MELLVIVLLNIFLFAKHIHAKPRFLPHHLLKCELEGLTTASKLADYYNSYDEDTEYDYRIHGEYFSLHLGYAPWISAGLWKNTHLTAQHLNVFDLQKKGGWIGTGNISESAYWPLHDVWLYTFGDSTSRQIWDVFQDPVKGQTFEAKRKSHLQDSCRRQSPHRKDHPAGGYFPDEGWGGKCGNNEQTCEFPGFGDHGKLTLDWKHFPYEDYDAYLFGEDGLWKQNSTAKSYPDVLIIHTGLHTCLHSLDHKNITLPQHHKDSIDFLFRDLTQALHRTPSILPKTKVIIELAGRSAYANPQIIKCQRNLNRYLARKAHQHGFIIFDREEIERRLVFKSEFNNERKLIATTMHLNPPASHIIATGILSIIQCLYRHDKKTE